MNPLEKLRLELYAKNIVKVRHEYLLRDRKFPKAEKNRIRIVLGELNEEIAEIERVLSCVAPQVLSSVSN